MKAKDSEAGESYEMACVPRLPMMHGTHYESVETSQCKFLLLRVRHYISIFSGGLATSACLSKFVGVERAANKAFVEAITFTIDCSVHVGHALRALC